LRVARYAERAEAQSQCFGDNRHVPEYGPCVAPDQALGILVLGSSLSRFRNKCDENTGCHLDKLSRAVASGSCRTAATWKFDKSVFYGVIALPALPLSGKQDVNRMHSASRRMRPRFLRCTEWSRAAATTSAREPQELPNLNFRDFRGELAPSLSLLHELDEVDEEGH